MAAFWSRVSHTVHQKMPTDPRWLINVLLRSTWKSPCVPPLKGIGFIAPPRPLVFIRSPRPRRHISHISSAAIRSGAQTNYENYNFGKKKVLTKGAGRNIFTNAFSRFLFQRTTLGRVFCFVGSLGFRLI